MTSTVIGKPVARIDGPLKVTGGARYAAEFNQPGQAHAVIITGSTPGRIRSISSREARMLPGVVAVLTHENVPRLAYGTFKGGLDPADGERLHILQDDHVYFHGQPVAIVVAETLDQAQRAANLVRVEIDGIRPVTGITGPGTEETASPSTLRQGARVAADRERGSADAAIANAAVKIAASYRMARENHNPMEPHATIASWQGESLTLWSKSQYVSNERNEIAAIFGIPVENVTVICPFVGGAFGTSLRTWAHVTAAAVAARETGRPVKLVLTRRQMFYNTGFRPETRQYLELGADREGRLTGIVHEAVTETSRYETYVEGVTSQSIMLYSCPNVRLRQRQVQGDIATPTFMRAPGEASGAFGIECAVDELAVALGMDPIELRRRNEPKIDESNGLPFSSRHLVECMEEGARRFGWDRRTAAPGSMKDGRLLIGWGMAAATRGAPQAACDARVELRPDGTFFVGVSTADMGPGTYTSMTQVAADTLGVPMERIDFQLGHTDLPIAPSHGGSWTMASVGTAVRAACLDLQDRMKSWATTDGASPLVNISTDDLGWYQGLLTAGTSSGEAMGYLALRELGSPAVGLASTSRPAEVARSYSMHGFGSFFAEVAVDPDLCTVRVRRLTGVYAIGRVINPRLARSQCISGMVGGISMALMEGTYLDARDGRPVNAHMADYLVPVNLDIGTLDTHFLDETDAQVNPLGVKGIGEISIVGVAPAIANAVYHATGKRIRDLPLRLDRLLEV